MKNDSETDDLIGRMRDGDVSALASLYERHGAAVYGLARRIVRNAADAEDVVQEAFLQAWTQASRFDNSRANGAGWLLMITRSRALDRVRSSSDRSRRAGGPVSVGDIQAGPEWATDRDLMRDDTRRALCQAAEALPAIQRIALELAFFEGLTHPEIAQVLCLPLGTVKTRIRIGLRRLRDRLNVEPAAATPSAPACPMDYTTT